MLRNGSRYSIAVRHSSGQIRVQQFPWYTLTFSNWATLPFLRGFPILLETVINGIRALNQASVLSGQEKSVSTGRAIASVALALLLAGGLFIVAPHALSFLMLHLNLGGDVDGVSFHIWDGFFKVAIFLFYVWLISLVPDIRRVFEYHGAEHKTVHAWENCIFVDACEAAGMNRLHPRCGTTFVLFVIVISIFLQTLFLPLIWESLPPLDTAARHGISLLIKIAFIIPVSAIAYELIYLAAQFSEGFSGRILQAPGLLLQRFTTAEPDQNELEVAIVALAEVVDHEEASAIGTAPYVRVPQTFTPILKG